MEALRTGSDNLRALPAKASVLLQIVVPTSVATTALATIAAFVIGATFVQVVLTRLTVLEISPSTMVPHQVVVAEFSKVRALRRFTVSGLGMTIGAQWDIIPGLLVIETIPSTSLAIVGV